MARAQTGNDAISEARRAFFEAGRTPVGQVPGAILQSWRRCRGLGLAANARPAIEPIDAPRLRIMREQHERLWRLARAEVEMLAADAADTGSIAILTDADGWILDAEGSAAFLDKAGRVALMPGACWSEARVGTNAIGTAIADGLAVEVRGAEHYAAPHRILNCAASPIFDPQGRMVGVLDISGDASVAQVHALGLAQMAVANIEHRYFDEGIADADLLRVHSNRALLGTAREGLLAFRNGRLVAANRVGLALFGLERGDLGRASYEALFDGAVSRLRDDGALHDRSGRVLYGHVDEPTRARRARAATPITVSSATSSRDADAPLFDEAQRDDLARACRVLDAGIPVLVLGETGTGKEVFSRELHRQCARAGKPFVAVNCAALPEGLIEAELFGYESGAFTGARKDGSQGLLRQADGGVLFLDEIGDMPMALQPRLLRVLQDRELSPLGGGRPVKLDFALVCATHRHLEEAVAEGRFRADLYYRISHHIVTLPSLREQPARDALVRTLWERIGQGRQLTPAARDALAQYGWPGNLRQLVASLRTLAALSEPGSDVGLDALPAYLRTRMAPMPRPLAPLDADLDAITLASMRAAVEACGGNIARAARQLGISRSTLYRRLGADPRVL
ncbi:sigma-54-dependent Fis family transcriptional regulator [Pseudoxanthomonas sp. Root630]|uniref:sigma-54-dependent Fis family transcriptional regulator n=1 Tax=Pseudoxanthomonas sp. Root630 TaxID=1736574 RepID=UPI0007031D4C|nr:sigma-54-dependent Fis family transcriptional regulator [Pseudoxanthomonas sp. Root630]KRA46922.1 AAA family ATPase [Pseudoxanthomonas sp. Root630]